MAGKTHSMRRLLALLLLLMPGMALAATCRDEMFDNTSFTLCEVGAGDDLQLFLTAFL